MSQQRTFTADSAREYAIKLTKAQLLQVLRRVDVTTRLPKAELVEAFVATYGRSA